MKYIYLLAVLQIVFIHSLRAVEGDIISPEFHYISVFPDVVENGDSITIEVKASDSESPLSGITVVITSPGNTQTTFISGSIGVGDPEVPYWEDTGDSLYIQKIKLNEYAISGIWYVSGVWVYDEESNFVHTSYTDSVLHEFTVISSMGDDEPPLVSDLYFSTDTALNGDSVKVFLKASDPVAGLDNALFIISSPSDMQVISFHGVFGDSDEEMWDTLGSDTYYTKIKVPDFAESGDWSMYLRIEDKAGNSDSFDELAAFYVKSSTPDLDPPILQEVIINPDTITQGDEIELLVNAVDSVSGLAFIQLALRNYDDEMSGSSIRYGTIAAPDEEVTEEDVEGGRKWEIEGDDWYSNVLTIADTILPGWFHVTYVRVRDTADNSQHISTAGKWDSVYVNPCYYSLGMNVAICEDESYYAGGADQTLSGIYYDTLYVPGACDTIVVTTLEVSVCDGVEYNELADHVVVYPNPSYGVLWLMLPENSTLVSWYVYNMTGSLIKKNIDPGQNRIDLSGYPAGLYTIRFIIDERIVIKRIRISTP